MRWWATISRTRFTSVVPRSTPGCEKPIYHGTLYRPNSIVQGSHGIDCVKVPLFRFFSSLPRITLGVNPLPGLVCLRNPSPIPCCGEPALLELEARVYVHVRKTCKAGNTRTARCFSCSKTRKTANARTTRCPTPAKLQQVTQSTTLQDGDSRTLQGRQLVCGIIRRWGLCLFLLQRRICGAASASFFFRPDKLVRCVLQR